MAEVRVVRARSSRVGAIYAVLVGALMVIGGLAGEDAAVGVVIAVVGIAIAIYGIAVLWRIGVYPSGAGVTLRGPAGARFIPWTDIDRFELGEGWPYRVWAVVRGGQAVKTYGLGGSGVRHRQSMDESRALVEQLQGMLNDHRGNKGEGA